MDVLDHKIQYHSLMAQYWIGMALTGTAKKRKMFHGTSDIELTDNEKTADAMETAHRHIGLVGEIIDKKEAEHVR